MSFLDPIEAIEMIDDVRALAIAAAYEAGRRA